MTTEIIILALLLGALAFWVVSLIANKPIAAIAGILAAGFTLYGDKFIPGGLPLGPVVLAVLLGAIAYYAVYALTPKEAEIAKTGKVKTWATLAAIVVVVIVLFGNFAYAATTFSITNSTTLAPGDYCVLDTHTLDGNKLTFKDSVTSGACTDGGENLTIEGAAVAEVTPTPTPEATPTPTPTATPAPVTIPAHCPQDVEYNVITVPVNASEIQGTSQADLIVAQSGVKVFAKGGNDCVQTTSGSRVEGDGGNDFIKTGTGSILKGGTGTDTCIAGSGSSKQSCEL